MSAALTYTYKGTEIEAIDREVNLLRDEQTSLRDKMEHLVIEG